MNIMLELLSGFEYLLWKLVKPLFNEGYWGWGIAVILIAIAIYYWIREDEPSVVLSAIKASEKDKDEVVAEVYKSSDSPQQIPGCLSCGKTLRHDRYRIINYISHGGFGNTYLAEDLSINKYIAIKELFLRDICTRQTVTENVQVSIETNKTTFDNLKRKFIKEAKRIQSFDCPNIIKVYDCFEENGTAYYTMDYIPGESLAAVVKEKGRLEEATLRGLLPDLLTALKLVHHEKVWHLDIKPANLMLRNNSSLILIDFGASKQFEDKEGMTVTSSSAIFYTSGYAPPEQVGNNTKNIGAWTDIYALGATLYNLLTGEKPPQADEILSEGLPPFPPIVSQQMANAITTMMQPNRNARPQTIDEVEQLLELDYEQTIYAI